MERKLVLEKLQLNAVAERNVPQEYAKHSLVAY